MSPTKNMRYVAGLRGSVPVPLVERFWNKVDKNGPVVRPELGPCWIWLAAVRPNGYGVIRSDTGRIVRAHRVAYELSGGQIPLGLDLRHSCDSRKCVNPAHLSPGTRLDNMREAVERGRMCRGERRPNSKLTEDDVRAIRARRVETGIGYLELGDQCGITRSAVGLICRRKLWAHVQ